MHQTLCIGHRGSKGHLPENTLPSFDLAITQGADWIELDVHLVDGELIVIHDDEVDRTTNGNGLISSYSLQELRALDAGNGARIPMLGEVLALVDNRCNINVELKGAGTAEPVSELLNSACENGWQPNDFLLSSFGHQELSLADPLYRRGALFGRIPGDWIEKAKQLDAWSVNFSLKSVTHSLVEDAHASGFKVLVYTVNKPADIDRLLGLGVDGLFSDYPDRLRSAIDARDMNDLR